LRSVAGSRCDSIPGGYEVLVIDDKSTDSSADLAEQAILEMQCPACLVRKDLNTGLADARNHGLDLARSRYVFTLDADNLVYPDCLARLYETISRTGAAATYSMIKKFDSKTGASLGLLSFLPWDVARLVRHPYIDAMAMFDREKVLSVGGYSTELIGCGWFGWEDYDLWLKFASEGYECVLRPEILSLYRAHGNSMVFLTPRYIPQFAAHFTEKFSRLVERYPDADMRFACPIKKIPANTVLATC
jgi:glycosyltransferase involved in cell wall biosynthesis